MQAIEKIFNSVC